MAYYSTVKKNENVPSAATQIALEGIMLSEICQTKTNAVGYHLCVETKKCNKIVNITQKKQTCRYREQRSGYWWGEGIGEGPSRGVGVKYNTGCKTGSSRSYTTWGIQLVFCNNCK